MQPATPRGPSAPRLVLLVIFLTVIQNAIPLLGSTVVALDGDALVRRSERIVHGVCIDRQSYRDPERGIVTRYRFQIHDTWKGEAGETLDLLQPGGSHGGLVTLVPGLRRHDIGDELVLFLGPTSPTSGFRFPVGLDQGVFGVVRDASNRLSRVQRRLEGLRLVAGSGEPGTSLPVAASLEAFEAEVRTRVADQEQADRKQR